MRARRTDELIKNKIRERISGVLKKGSFDTTGLTGGVRGASVSLWNELWDDPDGDYRDGEHLIRITTEGFDDIGFSTMIDVFGEKVSWNCIAFIYNKERDEDEHVDFGLTDGDPYIDIYIHTSSTDLIRTLGSDFSDLVWNDNDLKAVLRQWQVNCDIGHLEDISISDHSVTIKVAHDTLENKSLLVLMETINKEFPLSIPLQNYKIEVSPDDNTNIIVTYLTK